MKPNIVAFTGSHGTGKTTSVFEYAANAKKNFVSSVGVLMEVARDCPYPVMSRSNNQISEEAQMWIFGTQLSRELTEANRYDWLISDRTIVDCIAYTILGGHVSLADSMMAMAKQHMHVYSKIIFRPIANNPWCQDDGFRSTEHHTRQEIEKIMISLYAELDIKL